MVGKILAASYSEKNVARFALDRGKSPPPICVVFLSMPCYCRRREEESKMSDKFFLGGGNPSTPSLIASGSGWIPLAPPLTPA